MNEKVQSRIDGLALRLKAMGAVETRTLDIGIFVGIFVIAFLFLGHEPEDDLKRHIVAHLYNYDYAALYLYSNLPSYNPYILFDRLAGQFHVEFGYHAYRVLQALAIGLTAFACVTLLRTTNNATRLLIVAIVLYTMIDRLALARPTTFASALFVLGYALIDDKDWRRHVLIGTILAGLYHLFFIYLIPLALIRRVYFIPLALGLVGWTAYAGLEYFTVVWDLLTGQSESLIKVSEGGPLISWIVTVGAFVIPVIHHGRKDLRTLLVIGYFCLSNQIRYMDTLLPLALTYFRFYSITPGYSIVFPVMFMALAKTWQPAIAPPAIALQKDYFENRRILAIEMADMFSLAYANQNVKIAPNFNFGWTDLGLQKVISNATKTGLLDCAALANYQFDYVVEKGLKETPLCLELVEVSGPHRIWTTRHSQKPE